MTTKQERVKFIQTKLQKLYPAPVPSLEFKDPYTLLIAVLLSAQCTDKVVNRVTPALFKKADSPKKMSKLDVQTIQDIVRPCGLSERKAKAIYDLSHILLEKHDGEVPKTFKELEALPGVGHKTASVVLMQAFDIPAFPVDTHIHRLAKRWKLSTGKNVVQTEKDLKRLFPEKLWSKLHLQIIFFGREYCKAQGHDKKICPICSQI